MKFNHECGSIGEALGIDQEQADNLQALVFYSVVNQKWMAENLFDEPEQAPVNLTTKTGCLEAILESVSKENERIYCMYEYTRFETANDLVPPMTAIFLTEVENLYLKSNMDRDSFTKRFIKMKESKRSALADDDE